MWKVPWKACENKGIDFGIEAYFTIIFKKKYSLTLRRTIIIIVRVDKVITC